MIRSSATYAVIFYVLLAIWQAIFEAEILWISNIALALVAMFIYFLLEWLIAKYKKGKEW